MWREAPFLTKAMLRRNSGSVAPLVHTLLPPGEKEAGDVQHRMLWTLFSESAMTQTEKAQGRAAFLWRRMDEAGQFLVLGPKPVKTSPWFDIQTKPFDVTFAAGQRLAFDLRLSATVDRMVDSQKGRAGRYRSDIVLDALHASEQAGKPRDRSGSARLAAAQHAVEAWLAKRGSSPTGGGFDLAGCDVTGYQAVAAGKARRSPQVGVSDVSGALTVSNPDKFLAQLLTGFGRRKAYGCGLMLVRPLV